MKKIKAFKKLHPAYIESRNTAIKELVEKLNDEKISTIKVSRQLGKDDSYVSKMIKKPYISDETIFNIAEAIEILEAAEIVDEKGLL